MIPKTRIIFSILMVAAIAPGYLVPSVTAQESENNKAYRIEVKDGKVYVNGEIVKELEDADRPVFFSMDSDGETLLRDDEDSDRVFEPSHVRSPRWERFGPRRGKIVMRREMGPTDHGEAEVFAFFGDEPDREFVLDMGDDGEMSGQFFFGDDDSREIAGMERESRKLARKIRRANDEDRAELEQDLDSLLNSIFDAKQEIQEKRMEKLSSEVERLRQRIEERGTAKNDIIRRHKKDLLGDHDAYDW